MTGLPIRIFLSGVYTLPYAVFFRSSGCRQKLRGSFQELMEGTNDNYVHIVLTDETDIPDAMGKLRMRYPYLIGMKYDREETFDVSGIEELGQEAEKDPAALFSAFFEQVFPSGMSEEQEQIIQDLVREIWTKEDDE